MQKGGWVLGMVLLGIAGQACADARSDVLAAFDAAMEKKSYRATSTVEAKGRSTRTVIDVRLPASFHMRSPDTEMIILPGTSWMNSGGQWMKLPMDMSKTVQGLTLSAMKEGANLVRDVKELEPETVAGCAATRYGYRTEGRIMGVDVAADVELAVCDDTGLPVRLVSVDPKGKSRTVIDYDYDTPVDIRAPN
jgi:hypothetical protein